jgi:hypothetical protein
MPLDATQADQIAALARAPRSAPARWLDPFGGAFAA